MGEVFQKNSRPSFMKEIWDPKCLQFFDTIGHILYIYKMFNTFPFSVFQIFTRIELTLGETSIWKKSGFLAEIDHSSENSNLNQYLIIYENNI